MSLKLRPISLREANAFVDERHRHHGSKQGHKFSIACYDGEKLVGVAIVGRPDARMVDDGTLAEVTRLCTDGTPNACSILYAASARAAKAMGYLKIKTAILESESGHSLKASGWIYSHTTEAQEWSRPSRKREPTPHANVPKKIFVKELEHEI